MIWTSTTYIDDYKFYFRNKRGRDAGRPERKKQYHTNYAPMILERQALLLFKAVEFVPKTTQAAARTDIACASCEVRSFHLGLKSLDLLPPFQDKYICDICKRIYHWQGLL